MKTTHTRLTVTRASPVLIRGEMYAPCEVNYHGEPRFHWHKHGQPYAGQIGEEEQEQIHWRDLPNRTTIHTPIPGWLDPSLAPVEEPAEEKEKVPVRRRKKKEA